MISQYIYCGIYQCQNGSKRIWAAVSWVDGGYTRTYLAWGSSSNPLIKKFVFHNRMSKSQSLLARVAEKRKTWSGYKELKDDEIKIHLPQLESQIGMHVLAKKLKFG